MSTNYIWSILSMPAYPQAEGHVDVVFQVNWSCNANDGTYASVASGSVDVTYKAGSPYTPYNQLTQQQVWGWVNPSIDRPKVEADLQLLIDAQKNPKTITLPLPWN